MKKMKHPRVHKYYLIHFEIKFYYKNKILKLYFKGVMLKLTKESGFKKVNEGDKYARKFNNRNTQ